MSDGQPHLAAGRIAVMDQNAVRRTAWLPATPRLIHESKLVVALLSRGITPDADQLAEAAAA
jgi:hypothetical protein